VPGAVIAYIHIYSTLVFMHYILYYNLCFSLLIAESECLAPTWSCVFQAGLSLDAERVFGRFVVQNFVALLRAVVARCREAVGLRVLGAAVKGGSGRSVLAC
jgi:hypothetical protein